MDNKTNRLLKITIVLMIVSILLSLINLFI